MRQPQRSRKVAPKVARKLRKRSAGRKATARKPNTFLIWVGPSRFDGMPIGVFATLKSKNGKTGDMIQTTILRLDQSPSQAIATGADVSICALCKFRGINGAKRTCYVVVPRGPQSIYRAYAAGHIPGIPLKAFLPMIAGRGIRFGAYGDPAAAPVSLWRTLAKHATGHTGYTHQWQTAGLQGLVMARTHSAEEYAAAVALGYRSFRTKGKDDPRLPGEISCPASAESGKRTQCDRCRLCDGNVTTPEKDDRRANVAIVAHGPGAVHFVSLSSLRKAS